MTAFNVDEVYEMAEQIERNVAKFYRTSAASAGGDSRDLLLRLAEMEEDHLKTFAAMRSELSQADKRPVVFDPYNEGALYLQAMADGRVFSIDPAEALSGAEPIEDILDIAIDLEKDSIVFYQSMKEVVPASGSAEKLDAIIKQEIGHIVILTKQLEAITP